MKREAPQCRVLAGIAAGCRARLGGNNSQSKRCRPRGWCASGAAIIGSVIILSSQPTSPLMMRRMFLDYSTAMSAAFGNAPQWKQKHRARIKSVTLSDLSAPSAVRDAFGLCPIAQLLQAPTNRAPRAECGYGKCTQVNPSARVRGAPELT